MNDKIGGHFCILCTACGQIAAYFNFEDQRQEALDKIAKHKKCREKE